MSAETVRKLSALGLSVEQIVGVMEIMDAAADDVESREEARKANARERWHRWNDKLDLSKSEWLSLSETIKLRDNYTCVYCGKTDGPIHCDHVVPLSQGGTNEPNNLVAACRECNCGKSGRSLEQWRAYK